MKAILSLLTVLLMTYQFCSPSISLSQGQTEIINDNQTAAFWTIEKADDIYWLRSPEGNRIWLRAITTVQPEQQSIKPGGVMYRSVDIGENWAKRTTERIQEYGFNTVGSWSNHQLVIIPYTRDLNLIFYSHAQMGSLQWEQDIEHAIAKQVLPNDKNLVGYYTDNELDWKKYGPYAEKYFEITDRLLKKYDPNHLNLGVRFNKPPPPNVLKACDEHVDVISYNLYSDAAHLANGTLHKITESTTKPIIISEFGFFSPDNRSGCKNEAWVWSGLRLTQQGRAQGYRELAEAFARHPRIIGCELFQWNDEPPNGRGGDGEDVAWGVVDVFDQPYLEYVEAIIFVGQNAHEWHSQAK